MHPETCIHTLIGIEAGLYPLLWMHIYSVCTFTEDLDLISLETRNDLCRGSAYILGVAVT